MTQSVRVAAAQLTSRGDLSANLALCSELAAQAAGRGVRLLCLPECFAFLGRHEVDKRAIAEVIDDAAPGHVLGWAKATAKRHDLWILAGGVAERAPDAGTDPAAADSTPAKVYNTCLAVSPAGELCATYRKIHLFDVDIPGGATLRESDSTLPGREVVVLDTELGKIGLSICYDLRFPELYRQLGARGAEILVVPSAFTAHTGAAHWHVLLRARAVENQCFVIAAGQTGRHHDKRESYGHSLIIDPWGTVLADQGKEPGLAVADLDMELLAKTRRQMPCLDHRVLG
jgi:predicted amidohydrolase